MNFLSNASLLLQTNISSITNSSKNATTTWENSVDEYCLPETFVTLVLLTYLVFFVLSVLGNGTVCIAIGLRFLKPTVTNFFMGSLAACDVLISFIIPFTVLSNLVFMYWPFGTFLCPSISLVQLMTTLLRALTLVAMTCDRYYVLSRPFKGRLLAKQAKLVIVGIWIFSFIVCLPSGIFSEIIYLPHEPGSSGLCVEVWPQDTLRHIYGVVIMVMQYFVPLVLMLATYSHIAVIVWRKKTPGEANRKRDQRRARSKKKVRKKTYFFSYKMIIIISKTIFLLKIFAEFFSSLMLSENY